VSPHGPKRTWRSWPVMAAIGSEARPTSANPSGTFHMATSSASRKAVAYRPAASRFEGSRLQCRAPLDGGVIEQFEH
jgi:hypothetical protein